MKAKDENDPIEMMREMSGYQPKANHVDDDEDGVDAEVNAFYASIVAEREEAKKAAVSGKKWPTECASKTTAKDETYMNGIREMLRKMFGNEPKANDVDDDEDVFDAEVNAFTASIVAEREEAKKAAVSGKKQPTESNSKTTAKDETDKDGSIEMIREMSRYQPKANHVDDDEDGVDDEVNPIFDRIVVEGKEAKKAAVSGKKRPTECASKTTAKDETYINGIREMLRKMFGNEPKANDVDDDEDVVDAEVNAFTASIVAEREEGKKAAVSGKKRPTESASKATAKDETDKDGSIEMIREMSRYQPKANHVDDDEDGVDDEAAVSGKKRPTECASKTTAKDKTDINGTHEMLRKMFGNEPKANDVDNDEDGVDDEVNAFYASIVAEREEAKKAAVSGKKRPTESASKTTAKDETDKDGSIEMIREMSGYQPKANHVDDDEDGVDDEVKAIFDRIVAEGEEAKKAAVSGKKRPTESASKTPATEKKAKLISTAGRKTD